MDDARIPHWQLLGSTPMFDGYTRVRRDTYRLPDGSESDWDVLEQADTVAVVAFTTAASVPVFEQFRVCLLYTSPSPRDLSTSRMPSSA